MSDHPYGFLSLAPPIVAVTLAILSRRVLTSLLAGLVAGVLITTRGDVVQGTIDLFEKHLWSTLVQPDKLRIVCFTLCMGATIALIHATGGMRSLVAALRRCAGAAQRTARGVVRGAGDFFRRLRQLHALG